MKLELDAVRSQTLEECLPEARHQPLRFSHRRCHLLDLPGDLCVKPSYDVDSERSSLSPREAQMD